MKNTEAKILLLDDEKIEKENWKEWLQLCDWQPSLFYCSKISEALNVIHDTNPDIFLIDIFLKGESGFDFLDMVKNKRGIKIILTNSFENQDVKKSYEYGALLMNKQNDLSSCLKMVRLIKNLWEMARLPESDFVLNNTALQDFSVIINKNKDSIEQLHYNEKINILKISLIEEKTEVLEKIILGTNENLGLRERINSLEKQREDNMIKSIIVEFSKMQKENPFISFIILILLSIMIITFPIYLLHSLLGR